MTVVYFIRPYTVLVWVWEYEIRCLKN